jgi:hypothetical protein
MGKPYRLVVITVVLLGALAFAAPALATYSPRMVVSSSTQALGGAGVKIKFWEDSPDDPIQKVVVLVPKGYTVNTSMAAGTRLGTATAGVVASDLSAGATASGALVVANKTDFANDALACTNTAPAAVWSFTLAVRGSSFRLPVFVDTVAPTSGLPGVATLTMCIPAGDTPKGTPGRFVLGSKLLSLTMTTKAISSPKETGTYRWRASMTPYSPGIGSANLKGIVEVQSLVPVPLELTLKATVTPSPTAGFSRVTLTGTFNAAGSPVPGVFLTLSSGTKANKLKRLGVISTNRDGAFSTKGDIKQGRTASRRYIQASTTNLERDLGIGGCQPTVATVPCVDSTVSFNVSSKIVAFTIPARR